MKILFIGDIFGNNGIRAIEENIDKLIKDNNIDFVIANAENTTNCRGLSLSDYNKLKKLGINFFTMGNHTWRNKEWREVLKNNDIIRPYNIIDEDKINIGLGSRIIKFNNLRIRITNLIGTSLKSKFLNFDNPFVEMEKILANAEKPDIDIVDFHAETTSEKNCFLYAFKSRVHVILGTHTHIQTNDAKIVDGTAYISDVGMTGPYDGVIGAEPNSLVEMFYGRNEFFRLTEASGKYQLSAVIIDIDEVNKKVKSINNFIKVENN